MYPKINKHLSKVYIEESFTLNDNDLNLINKHCREKNKLGFSVFLKVYQYLNYPPDRKENIPINVIEYIANQLAESKNIWENYKWKNRTWKRHLNIIRNYTEIKPYEKYSTTSLLNDIAKYVPDNLIKKELSLVMVERFKAFKLEFPSDYTFNRLLNSCRKKYFNDLYNIISQNLTQNNKDMIDRMLDSNEKKDYGYNKLKAHPKKLGVNTILDEINKLKYLRQFKIDKNMFINLSEKVIEKLYKRICSYNVSRVRKLKDNIKYTLFYIFAYVREQELLDNIVKIFLELIKRIDNRSARSIEKSVTKSVKKIYSKSSILKRIVLAVTENPEGNIKEVIFPKIDFKTFQELKEEFDSDKEEDSYDIEKAKRMKSRYTSHYRKMMKPILDELDFRSNNSSWDSILESIKIISKYIDTKYIFYPEDEDIPLDIIPYKYKSIALNTTSDGILRVRKHYFELCVLEKLEKALKCKEIYIEGSLKYRNPVNDLPVNWEEEKAKYYQKINTTLNKDKFVNSIKDKLSSSLDMANNYFSRKKEVYIYSQKGFDRGFFRVPPIKKEEESKIVKHLKELVIKKYNKIALLDVLVETDKHINFSQFFHTKTERQILGKDGIKERLLLNIFSLGTNIELKRIHSSTSTNCSYDDLLYFRKRYMTTEALRTCVVGLTNRILKIRNPDIWGIGTSCACDGKQFTSYNQNLMASSNPHYPKTGIMVYWHVDNNSTCIYSQLKHSNSSEVVSMIEGLIRHETEMKIEKSYTDNRGQSEVAFAFCHFLGIDLMPRFSKVKYKRLYSPDKDISKYFNLESVIDKPINWKLIEKQYDEMVKHVVAIVNGNGSTESILRRFSTYNNSHPTYKAFRELGRAMKTVFLCKYLTNKSIRKEIHQGLNTVENWNAINSFISYGDKYEFNTNNPIIQEMTVLSLHLLQNAIIFVNTILLDKVIEDNCILDEMTERDKRALTPLFTSNINPYGRFMLNLNKKSILEAA